MDITKGLVLVDLNDKYMQRIQCQFIQQVLIQTVQYDLNQGARGLSNVAIHLFLNYFSVPHLSAFGTN